MSQLEYTNQLTLKEFEKLFRENYPALRVYARRYVTDLQTSEDLIQDVFFHLWHKRHDISIRTSPRAYLFASLRNTCLNYLKNKRLRTTSGGVNIPVDELIHSSCLQALLDSGNTLYEKEFMEALQKSIDELPAQCRTVFMMSRFEYLKNKEIADKLGISVKAVEKHITKALGFLRTNLRELFIYLSFYYFFE